MVEAVDHLWLVFTILLDIYQVFKHLSMMYYPNEARSDIGVWWRPVVGVHDPGCRKWEGASQPWKKINNNTKYSSVASLLKLPSTMHVIKKVDEEEKALMNGYDDESEGILHKMTCQKLISFRMINLTIAMEGVNEILILFILSLSIESCFSR